MATPFVRGMTFTSRVATADINSLTFQRRAEIPKSVMATPFVRGYGPTASGGLTGEGGKELPQTPEGAFKLYG